MTNKDSYQWGDYDDGDFAFHPISVIFVTSQTFLCLPSGFIASKFSLPLVADEESLQKAFDLAVRHLCISGLSVMLAAKLTYPNNCLKSRLQ